MSSIARAGLLCAAVVAAAPVALAQQPVMQRSGASPIVSATAKAIPTSADIAAMAAASRESLYIMRASYAARTKGTTAVRPLADTLIAYHTQALSDFRGALQAAGMRAPAVGLTAAQERKLAALEAESGAAFDAKFVAEARASQKAASDALLAHGKTKGNIIVTAQATRQGNQIVALNAKTK